MSNAMPVVDFSILVEINERLKRLELHHSKLAELEQEKTMTAIEAAQFILGEDANDLEIHKKAEALNKRAYRRSIPSVRDGRAYKFTRRDLEPMRRGGR